MKKIKCKDHQKARLDGDRKIYIFFYFKSRWHQLIVKEMLLPMLN